MRHYLASSLLSPRINNEIQHQTCPQTAMLRGVRNFRKCLHRCEEITASGVVVAIYDRPVPARLSSLIPIAGILLKRRLLDEEELAELGDEV